MPIKCFHNRGVTLIETIVFIVVLSVALTALVRVFNQSVGQSVDPIIRIKALEKGQAMMDEILARKFDENTPTGGVPACNSSAGVACAGISSDSDYDDVGDYNGFSDNSEPAFALSVVVVEAGSDLGLSNTMARRISVTVGMPDGNAIVLSAYKVNF